MSSFFYFFETCAVQFITVAMNTPKSKCLTHRVSFVWQQTFTTGCGVSTAISSLASLVFSTILVDSAKEIQLSALTFATSISFTLTGHSRNSGSGSPPQLQTIFLLHTTLQYTLFVCTHLKHDKILYNSYTAVVWGRKVIQRILHNQAA